MRWKVMKTCKRITLCVSASMLFLMGMLVATASPATYEKLLWEARIPHSGEEVVSSVWGRGEYRIVAAEIWWYDYASNLAADAQYYTTDPSGYWYWGNNFPAPGGHSFLQINAEDVDWGPFSNGDTGHEYTIYYTWEGGSAITFRIVDWMDGDYDNNDCYIVVKIYKSVTVGGYVVDSNPSDIVALLITSALTLAGIVTVPIVKYLRNPHRRIA